MAAGEHQMAAGEHQMAAVVHQTAAEDHQTAAEKSSLAHPLDQGNRGFSIRPSGTLSDGRQVHV